MNLDLMLTQLRGTLPADVLQPRIPLPGAPEVLSAPLPKSRRHQEERGVRALVPQLPPEAGAKLSAPEEIPCRTGRLPPLRVSKAIAR